MEAGQLPADAATLILSFSANEMTDPETFPSLLFYYGILTIEEQKVAESYLAYLTIMCVNNTTTIY